MALKWIYGNFKTGSTNVSQVLPVVRGTDLITLNFSNEDFAVLELSKRDLPDPVSWKRFLSAPDTMVAAIDDELAWNAEGAVLFAGFIKEARATANDTIKVQIAGMREYASNRLPLPVYTGAVTDPKGGKTFQGSDHQRLLQAVMAELYNTYSVSPGSAPTPPAVQGSQTVTPNTGAVTYKTLAGSFQTIADILDDISIATSLNGNEYRFTPRWASSSRTSIVWDSVTGSNSVPQLFYTTHTFSVDLASNNFVTAASNSLSSTDYATRIVGQSIYGDDTVKSDLTISAISGAQAANTILWDTSYNPGQELPAATLQAQMAARLTFQKNLQEGGEVGVVLNADPLWRTRVGAKVIMNGGVEEHGVSGISLTARLAQVEFSLSSTAVKTLLVSPKPRYGKLPNSPTKKNQIGSNPNTPGSGWGGGSIYNPGGGTGPIKPVQPPNVPEPGGGGVTPPDFDTPVFNASKPFFVSVRKSPTVSHSNALGYREASSLYPATDFSSAIVASAGYFKVMNQYTWLTCADATACDARFASAGYSYTGMQPIKFYRSVFARTGNPTLVPLNIDFTLKDHITSWADLTGSGMADVYAHPELDATHSSGGAMHISDVTTVFWVNDNDIYLWVLGSTGVSKQTPQGGSNVAHMHSTASGTILFKNTLSGGSASTWTVVKKNIKDTKGRLFFPYSQDSIIVRSNGETLIYGGLRYDGTGMSANLGQLVQPRVLDSADPSDKAKLIQTPHHERSVHTLSPSGVLSEKSMAMPIPDLSEREYSTIEFENLTPVSGYPSLIKKMEISPRYPYLAKRSGNASTLGVFQLPAVYGSSLPADGKSSEPGVFRQLNAFYGSQSGDLNRVTSEELDLNDLFSDPLNNKIFSIGFIKEWFVVLGFARNAANTGHELVSYRTKNNGQTWVKAVESELIAAGLGFLGDVRRDLGTRLDTRLSQRVDPFSKTIGQETLGTKIATTGDYGIMNYTSSNALGTLAFRIDETL